LGRRKRGKIDNDPTKHYPGKGEAKLLRQLKSRTGLTEEQIRSHKKYRIMLSNTQKDESKYTISDTDKSYKHLIKSSCKITGLTPQHPETLKVIQERLDRGFYLGTKLTAKQIVKHYAKK
jgi:hypothetical protein